MMLLGKLGPLGLTQEGTQWFDGRGGALKRHIPVIIHEWGLKVYEGCE